MDGPKWGKLTVPKVDGPGLKWTICDGKWRVLRKADDLLTKSGLSRDKVYGLQYWMVCGKSYRSKGWKWTVQRINVNCPMGEPWTVHSMSFRTVLFDPGPSTYGALDRPLSSSWSAHFPPTPSTFTESFTSTHSYKKLINFQKLFSGGGDYNYWQIYCHKLPFELTHHDLRINEFRWNDELFEFEFWLFWFSSIEFRFDPNCRARSRTDPCLLNIGSSLTSEPVSWTLFLMELWRVQKATRSLNLLFPVITLNW